MKFMHQGNLACAQKFISKYFVNSIRCIEMYTSVFQCKNTTSKKCMTYKIIALNTVEDLTNIPISRNIYESKILISFKIHFIIDILK